MIVGDLTSANFIWIPRDGAVAGLRFRAGWAGSESAEVPDRAHIPLLDQPQAVALVRDFVKDLA